MWHKPCRTFHHWCPCIKTRCLSPLVPPICVSNATYAALASVNRVNIDSENGVSHGLGRQQAIIWTKAAYCQLDPSWHSIQIWGNTETHRDRDTMAAILPRVISSKEFSYLKIVIYVSLKFVPKGPIDNKSDKVQIIAWRRTRSTI